MKTLVIPDIHGKPKLLRSMLDNDADRIVQIGDLANCVYQDRDGDLECLELALELQNSTNFELLVGNHEHPYFGGGRFSGFASIPEIKEAIKRLNWKAATVVGDALVTHAGVAPRVLRNYNASIMPHILMDEINSLWRSNPRMPIFENTGYLRGGRVPVGGILWRDISEPIDTRFNQIFGHSKGKDFRYGPTKNYTWVCIDCEKPYIVEEPEL
jgi:hypothetical protein